MQNPDLEITHTISLAPVELQIPIYGKIPTRLDITADGTIDLTIGNASELRFIFERSKKYGTLLTSRYVGFPSRSKIIKIDINIDIDALDRKKKGSIYAGQSNVDIIDYFSNANWAYQMAETAIKTNLQHLKRDETSHFVREILRNALADLGKGLESVCNTPRAFGRKV